MSELNGSVAELTERVRQLEDKLNRRYNGPVVKAPPVGEYQTIIRDSNDPGYVNRLLVGTATTGSVRIEWVAARYGQVVPTNWSMVQMNQYIDAYIPLRYQVADAQNLIVGQAIKDNFQWLLLYEHDVCPPPDGFKRLNDYMIERQVPVVSGLYYTRSRPSEPLIYRGRGTGYHVDWEFGDQVWCDGVPTGFLLVHVGILREMWNDAEEYIIQHPDGRRDVTRSVFETPRKQWFNPDTGEYNISTGTSDLDWCTKVMEGGYFGKAGWKEYDDVEYPFVVDTNIFCRHINPDGEQFP